MPHFEESHTPWYRVKSPLNKGPEKLEPAEGSVSAGEERDGYYPGHQGLGLGCTKLGLQSTKNESNGENFVPYSHLLDVIMKYHETMRIYDHLWPICFLINSKFWWLICCDCDPFLPRSSKGQLVASMNERCARTKQRFGHVLGLFLTHSKSLFGVVSSSLLLIPLPWPMIFHDHVWGFSFPQVAVVIPHRYFFDKNIFAASSGQVSSFPLPVPWSSLMLLLHALSFLDMPMMFEDCTPVWYMGVSWNGGTTKSSIWIGFSILNHPFWDILGYLQYPHLWKSPCRLLFASRGSSVLWSPLRSRSDCQLRRCSAPSWDVWGSGRCNAKGQLQDIPGVSEVTLWHVKPEVINHKKPLGPLGYLVWRVPFKYESITIWGEPP